MTDRPRGRHARPDTQVDAASPRPVHPSTASAGASGVSGATESHTSAPVAASGGARVSQKPTPIAAYTTFRVGGPAASTVVATTRDQLVDAVRNTWRAHDEPLLIGGGSNSLVSDDGFDGTLIRVATSGIERVSADVPEGIVRLRVEAGESWDGLVAHAVEQGWAGIEALSGIPGSCGAAPIQNIGAYGQELESVLVAVDLLDRGTLEVTRVPAAELGLGYRTSTLKRHSGDEPERDAVVLGIEIDLRDNGGQSEPIAYAQLAFSLGVELGERLSVAQVRKTVLALRTSKGMVWDASDPDTWSAGSFFTNPVVAESFARTLPERAPRWPVDSDDDAVTVIPLDEFTGQIQRPAPREAQVKLSAAWLIENAGVHRGFQLPGSHAAISSKHTLALTNRGGASADEIAELARYVQSRVQSEFGVILQPEPVLVGVEI
ncbi:UDP-N-acetylmuramate dehydrogenase [Okibacterium fritillariae]|uniref:UDP-N-acetylenolpyruvoylglucosamine reductase n=1 Tax=Okibacterium fritillariae TaxID=123320 RepID=A0A1T5IR04_9MICO|nr:UDP-N-acetylmuramate dehydrogenase [Okibacterium fritillariae]SKC41373.1 UDP-N-acetylmuramate dehydrogenase [Okibacterium fritillariae]